MPEEDQSLFYRTVLKHVREKPHLEDVPRVSEEDYKWPPEEFNPNKSIARKESLSNILRGYYGDALEDEVMRARSANIYQSKTRTGPVVDPKSYSRIFEDFPVNFEQYSRGNRYNIPEKTVYLEGRKDRAQAKETFEQYKRNLSSSDPKDRHNANWWFTVNSLRPDISPDDEPGSLQHEIGHAAWGTPPGKAEMALPIKDAPILYFQDRWQHKTAPFEYKGKMLTQNSIPHVGKSHEIVQAAGRFQREHFKATGSRVKYGDFTKLVLSDEVPDYLSQEGQRILKYARTTMDKIDRIFRHEDKLPEEKIQGIKKQFLDRLETILPTVVDVEEPSQIRRI